MFNVKNNIKMKKVSSFLSMGFLILVLITACQQTRDKVEDTGSDKMEEAMPAQDSTQVTYACPMHPEEISQEPGKCSKCGMELVKKRSQQRHE
jgi:uncharacterized paraquat-inducible protein A